jgi:gliding motility-associated-like protein
MKKQHMKYTLFIILTLITCQGFSQSSSLIHVGTEEKMTITAGAILHADGISLKPSEDFSLSNNALKRVNTSGAKLDNQISRVFQFTNPTTAFTGNLKKDYLDSELNGLAEQNLQLFVFNADKWHRQPTLNDISVNSLTSDINQLALSEISSAVFMPNLTFTVSSIAENSPIATKVADISGTNQNIVGNAFTYSLISGSGSSNNTSFTIKDSELLSNTVLDFEQKKSYSARVRVTDGYGRSDEKIVVINITDVNEAPTALAISKANIYESNAIDEMIGSLNTTDQDASDSHTYSLVSGAGSTDNAAFRILNGELRATQVFKYDTKNSYSVRVRTTDVGGLSHDQVFTITVSQTPVLTGTGNETYPNRRIAASANPSISLGYGSDLFVSGADIVSYNWTPSTGLNSSTISSPTATPKTTTTYTVEVTNRFGSKTKVAITVTVREDYNITPSNILSPNGDGENDGWVIENLAAYPNNKVTILDRTGKIIYTRINYTNDWNGTFNGVNLPEGTYFYVITLNNGEGEKKGYITIIN